MGQGFAGISGREAASRVRIELLLIAFMTLAAVVMVFRNNAEVFGAKHSGSIQICSVRVGSYQANAQLDLLATLKYSRGPAFVPVWLLYIVWLTHQHLTIDPQEYCARASHALLFKLLCLSSVGCFDRAGCTAQFNLRGPPETCSNYFIMPAEYFAVKLSTRVLHCCRYRMTPTNQDSDLHSDAGWPCCRLCGLTRPVPALQKQQRLQRSKLEPGDPSRGTAVPEPAVRATAHGQGCADLLRGGARC